MISGVMAFLGWALSVLYLAGNHVKTGGSWRYYPMGRHLMGFVFSLSVVYAVIILSFVCGPFPGWTWALVLALVNGALVQRNWLLFTKKWRYRGPGSDDKFSDHTIRE